MKGSPNGEPFLCCYTKSIVEIDDISRTKRDKDGQKMLTLQKKSANEHH